jgi:transcriptional regulator with XRE-family HTH domain
MKLGIRICERRKKLGYTQVQLGELVHLDATTISKIEHGERTLSTEQLERFAKALHTTERWLLHGEGPYEASEEERDGPQAVAQLRADNAKLRGQLEEAKGTSANLLDLIKDMIHSLRGGNG